MSVKVFIIKHRILPVRKTYEDSCIYNQYMISIHIDDRVRFAQIIKSKLPACHECVDCKTCPISASVMNARTRSSQLFDSHYMHQFNNETILIQDIFDALKIKNNEITVIYQSLQISSDEISSLFNFMLADKWLANNVSLNYISYSTSYTEINKFIDHYYNNQLSNDGCSDVPPASNDIKNPIVIFHATKERVFFSHNNYRICILPPIYESQRVFTVITQYNGIGVDKHQCISEPEMKLWIALWFFTHVCSSGDKCTIMYDNDESKEYHCWKEFFDYVNAEIKVQHVDMTYGDYLELRSKLSK